MFRIVNLDSGRKGVRVYDTVDEAYAAIKLLGDPHAYDVVYA